MSGRTRNLSIPAFLGIVIVYLAIIQGGGRLLGSGLENHTSSTLPNAEIVLRTAVIPIAISVLFGVLVASWLGWWDEILHERKPVQSWVAIVPIAMLVFAFFCIAYAHLAGQTTSLVLSFLLLVALVGIGEELMFRGIGIAVLRRRGLSEGKVALFSSVIFGLVHLSNALDTGSTAVLQAAVVSFAGYFFYLSRRVGGGLWLPICVHASWDMSLLSSQLGPDPAVYPLSGILVFLQLFLIVRLIRRRKRIDRVWREGTPPEPAAV